jgi:hypothetical protein
MGLYLNLTGEVEFSVEQFGSIGVGQLWRMAVVAGTNGIRPAPTPQPPAALSGQRSWMERLYGCPSIPGIPVREVEVSREQPLKFTSRNHATILSVQMTSMSIPAAFQGRNVVKCLIPCGEF